MLLKQYYKVPSSDLSDLDQHLRRQLYVMYLVMFMTLVVRLNSCRLSGMLSSFGLLGTKFHFNE